MDTCFQEHCNTIQHLITLLFLFLLFFIILDPNKDAFNLQGNKENTKKNKTTQVNFPLLLFALEKKVAYFHCWRNRYKTCYCLCRFSIIMFKEGKLKWVA